MSVNELILNLGKGDNVASNKIFAGVMADKIVSALNAKKIEVASTLGKVLPEQEENNLDQE